MSNSRLLLMSLSLGLILIIGGGVVMSMSSKLGTGESTLPAPAAIEVNHAGAATTPNAGEGANAANNTQAGGGQAPQGSPVSNANTATTANAENQAVYCPKQSELFKKEMLWYGPNTWRDYSSSFVKNINNFAGAQWVGVNVGKIICLYKGVEENDFPIALERDNLMKKPNGQNWKPDPSGYQICKSDKIEDCPFYPEAVKSEENMYDFLHDIKKSK